MSEDFLPIVDWVLMDAREQIVWSTAFALRALKIERDDAVSAANATVRALRRSTSAANAPPDPALRAAHAAIEISRGDFASWYTVELAIQATQHSRHEVILTADDIAQAFERYRRGRTDFY